MNADQIVGMRKSVLMSNRRAWSPDRAMALKRSAKHRGASAGDNITSRTGVLNHHANIKASRSATSHKPFHTASARDGRKAAPVEMGSATSGSPPDGQKLRCTYPAGINSGSSSASLRTSTYVNSVSEGSVDRSESGQFSSDAQRGKVMEDVTSRDLNRRSPTSAGKGAVAL